MKIGILTFHSQLNYGGVLQAYALQASLEALGHEAIVLDWWFAPDNRALLGPFVTPFFLCKWFLRYLLGLVTWGEMVRHWKTIRFLRRHLRRTSYHFCSWPELEGRDLGVDCLVVGSDQVWNATYLDPAPFLLAGAPAGLPAISYAASFGMASIPPAREGLFREGLGRFAAISVRETEGVGLVRRCGREATHVVDPVLLAPSSLWAPFVSFRPPSRPVLVCYLLSVNPYEIAGDLIAFQDRTGCEVRIYTNPDPFRRLEKAVDGPRRRLASRLRFCRAADPGDFVGAIASARWVLTDSYHAVLFSLLFDKNARVLRPSSSHRKGMFARIDELLRDKTVTGPFLADTIDDALASFTTGERPLYDHGRLDKKRAASASWLREALDNLPRPSSPRHV